MKTIFINAGHHNADQGAHHNGFKESELNIALRDVVVLRLKEEGYTIESVPDRLTLRESIAWINERTESTDFAFSIHFNSHRNLQVRGTSVYYSSEEERNIAKIFSENIAGALDFWNQGAIHDSQSWIGELGWLRKLKCPSVLVEVCYLTNEIDMREYNAGLATDGFLGALLEIFPLPKPVPIPEPKPTYQPLEENIEPVCIPRPLWRIVLDFIRFKK